MKIALHKIKTSVISCALACGTLMSAQAMASVDIADTPLYLGVQADPNIMFILDDSGSMQWEFMPDDVLSQLPSAAMYPLPRNVYGGDDYTYDFCGGDGVTQNLYFVPTFNDSSLHVVRLRSSHINKMYYNPDVEYEPWYDSTGTRMPDANPRSAYYNPANTALGSMDLLSSQTRTAYWFEGAPTVAEPWRLNWAPGITCNGVALTFQPITYFNFTGTDENDPSHYTKVEITSSTNASATFTSPNGTTRTRDQEIQNFANWFTYYRSRVLASRAGIGAAFANQSDSLRVGFATINKGSSSVDGVSTDTVVTGVRPFTGAARTDFYNNLYNRTIPKAGTPLRKALDDVGQYYSRTDDRGPWGNTPGTADTSAHTECRKSFSILMTDGYWSDGTANQATTAAARADNDSTNGVTHVNALSDNFVERGTGNYTGYLASDPFQDSNANTLADVAMYYWKNDLRSDLDNRIRVTQQGDGTQEIANPAYWQHMITFGVGLGVTGAQDPDAAFQAVKDGTAISWGDPTDASNIDAQNQAKLDDLLHASINSRGGFFSAASPDEFAARLRGILNQIASDESSSSSAVANTTRLDTDTLIYQAKFDPENWSGQLLAYTIEDDGSVDEDSPAWDADDKLPGHDARTILTYRPGSGASAGGAQFEWTNLTNTQKAYLNTDIFGNTDGEGQNRLEFLRGDTSITGPASNPFRDRTALSTKDTDGYDILGDIINSDPIYVGTGDFGYGRESSGLTATEKADYNTFRSNPTYRSRDGMIYIGANDGMFHGFDATTGREKFAYIPNALFPKLSALTSPDYTHQYYVDATPHMGDVYINNSWKTVVTSTLGAGGRAIFAIDVTDPDSVSASDVMWEVEANNADSNLRHMGYMLGKPQMVRTKSGDWVVLVGNGYNSADHQAALIVLDAEDGSVLKVINTGVGSAAEPNGLSTPLAVDLDGDRILDNVYAGDLHGNLWKFDLTANNPSNWGIALKSGNKVEPLFQACDGTGACTAATRQPITVQPTIASHPEGVMILFGTGKFFETADATVSASPRIESLYGIFDCGADSLRRACKGSTVVKSELVQQSILVEDTLTTASLSIDYRVGSDEDVTISNRVQGWYMDLIPPGTVTGEGERIVANPVLVNDAVLFVSFIPDGNPCNFGGYSWLMEFDPKTGGRFDSPKLDVNGDGIIDDDDLVADPNNPTGDKVAPCCIGQPEKRSAPGILHGGGPDGKTVFKVFSGSSGNIDVEINKGVNKAGRQSWRQLR